MLPIDLLAVEKVFDDFWGRPRVRALHPLTLTLEPGEVMGLLGPNGSGKSTTIKLVLGLLRPTRGRVLLLGGSPDAPATRARVGYLPEETRLHRFLDPRETLDLHLRLFGLPRQERQRRTDQLVEMVGLRGNEGRAVGEFSKGMARRIGLAVALAGDPDVLVLDEPTSGLDPLGTREIKDLVVELRRRGRSILLSSHLLDDVEDVADRIAILYGGKLRRLGPTGELLEQRGRLRIELDAPEAIDPDAIGSDVRALFPRAGRVDVSTPSDRLENLFRRVVEEAERGHEVTAGARQGGPIAAFLGEGAIAARPADWTAGPPHPAAASPSASAAAARLASAPPGAPAGAQRAASASASAARPLGLPHAASPDLVDALAPGVDGALVRLAGGTPDLPAAASSASVDAAERRLAASGGAPDAPGERRAAAFEPLRPAAATASTVTSDVVARLAASGGAPDPAPPGERGGSGAQPPIGAAFEPLRPVASVAPSSATSDVVARLAASGGAPDAAPPGERGGSGAQPPSGAAFEPLRPVASVAPSSATSDVVARLAAGGGAPDAAPPGERGGSGAQPLIGAAFEPLRPVASVAPSSTTSDVVARLAVPTGEHRAPAGEPPRPAAASSVATSAVLGRLGAAPEPTHRPGVFESLAPRAPATTPPAARPAATERVLRRLLGPAGSPGEAARAAGRANREVHPQIVPTRPADQAFRPADPVEERPPR